MNEPAIWIKRTCIVAVAAVAAVAAVVSFDHMRALASDAGEGWKAWILPISVDGMLVRLVAAWPPVALGLSFELLLTLIRETAAVHEHAPQQVVAAQPVVHERLEPLPKAPPKRPRKLLQDYVNEARQHLGPDVNVTPAWVREVTDCSRGLSPKIAATLKADMR